MNELNNIRSELSEALTAKRFRHTEGVAYTAACLAMRYGEDIKKAEIAGLLHDCAKCIDNETKINICIKNNIEISPSESRNPFLLHAKVGAYIAETKYGISDPDILNSIRYHTTGRPNMSLLEKIIYVADYIEPCRNKVENLSEVRRICFENLEQGLSVILKDTLTHLKESKKELDPMTQYTYEYYQTNKGV